ncbi:hypothetical protein CEXT_137571, partial [Caerostris extrusa]
RDLTLNRALFEEVVNWVPRVSWRSPLKLKFPFGAAPK